MMNKMFLSCLFLSTLTFNIYSVFGDSDSHDHDDDHDDEHDEHSCHFGMAPYLEVPIVEAECAYMTNADNDNEMSWKFECIDENGGILYKYSGTECDDDNMESAMNITDTNSFDCSTESECDVVIVTRMWYGNDSMMTDCSDGTAVTTTSFYVTSGSSCVYDLDGNYLSAQVDSGEFILNMYDSSSCNGDASMSYNFSDGCREAVLDNSGYASFEVELEEDDDSAYGLNSISSLVSVTVIAAVYSTVF